MTSGGTPETAVRLSPSVEAVFRRLASEPHVSSWKLVREILDGHPEYLGDNGSRVARGMPRAGAFAYSIDRWITELGRALRPGTRLHGRLLIVAPARVDPILGDSLRELDVLPSIQRKIQEQVDVLSASGRDVDHKFPWRRADFPSASPRT